jgi:predicted unusual protein kinase regulating ubiquinone biosynthesis (AarF/ABC1/UbiB family)
VHDVRRKLPRFHWRPLSGIRAGEALADLQRIALDHAIALPTAFALVGKTLAQADAIARTLDPELDPIALMEAEALDVMMVEAERRLEPKRLFAYLYTQLDPLSRLPRKAAHVLSELEQGSFKVGVVPTGLDELGANLRSTANRLGAAVVLGALLLSSSIIVRVHRFEWIGIAGYALAIALGLTMAWKLVRTPGRL